VTLEVIDKQILPMVEKLAGDEIPNIRFNVAKTYLVLIKVLRRLSEQGTIYELEKAGAPFDASPLGQTLIDERVRPALEKLQKDDDVDVRFFATQAAAAADGQTTAGEPMNTSP
jgi:serine/threonine-protein phosphatase 2A regulatory subunit A